jgi:hypothetical protein
MTLPDITMAQAVLILGVIFAWLLFIVVRAWFER